MYVCVHYTLQVDVYAYNLTEEIWVSLQSSLQKNLDWLKLRHGLLQHIVLQKMGLFDHTEAEDMEPWTSVSYWWEQVSMYTTHHVGGVRVCGCVCVHHPSRLWECGCGLPAKLVGVSVSVYILKTFIIFCPTFNTVHVCRYWNKKFK